MRANVFRGAIPDDYHAPKSTPQTEITALTFFVSFDLSGSTALKSRHGRWADVIQYFYSQSVEHVQDAEPAFRVWKYIGDEVALYAYAPTLPVLLEWVSIAFRCERSILQAVKQQFPDLKAILSVKAIAWIAPITGYADLREELEESSSSELQRIAAELRARDLRFRDIKGNIDFIGPSIDAGFRLARFARPLQLTVSPALAYYFYKGAKRTNDLRIVGFESLKGVASGQLYPAIWYHENWERAWTDFHYADRFTDDLVQSVCRGHHESIEVLDEVKAAFGDSFYFFDIVALERLVNISGRFVTYLT